MAAACSGPNDLSPDQRKVDHMVHLAHIQESVQPPSPAFALSDIDAALQLAARIVAVRFGLAPHVAQLIASLAGLGEVRQ